MSKSSKLKTLANGIGAARHAVALVIVVVTGIVSGTLLYAQVEINEKTGTENEKKIEAIRETLSGINTKQQVIINEIEGEKQMAEDFRGDTRTTLDLILQQLISRDRNRSPIR